MPPHLIANLPDFGDERLDSVPLTSQPLPIRTPWLPLPPRQPDAQPGAPACPTGAAEMLTEGGRKRLSAWLEATRAGLIAIRDGLEMGVIGR